MPAFTSTLPDATPRLIAIAGAELERGLDLVDAARGDADREEPAAAEQRDGEAERMLALREVELHRRRPARRTAG